MAHFSLKDNQGPIWMDGRLVAWNEAQLHVLSHGLNYASSVFEGERFYAGKIFKLKEHTERFLESARLLRFPLPFTLEQLCAATEEVVAAQGFRDGYIRPVAWRGHEGLGISAPNTTTHVAIAAVPMGALFTPEKKKAGLSLQVSRWRRPEPEMAPIKAKAACHYVAGGLAIREAQEAGFDDALMLDARGDIAESSGSNFFIVRDGVVRTPIPDRALDGITRRTVMELAGERGIEVVEERIRPDALASAQEAFLTGTAYEVIGVGRIGDLAFSGPRPVTDALTEAYDRLVGKERP